MELFDWSHNRKQTTKVFEIENKAGLSKCDIFKTPGFASRRCDRFGLSLISCMLSLMHFHATVVRRGKPLWGVLAIWVLVALIGACGGDVDDGLVLDTAVPATADSGVSVKILSIGLDRHIPGNGQFSLKYRLANENAPRTLRLDIQRRHDDISRYLSGVRIAPQRISLKKGASHEGEWLIPSNTAMGWYVPESGDGDSIFLVVRDDRTNKIVSLTALPALNIHTNPVVVLAATEDLAITFENAVSLQPAKETWNQFETVRLSAFFPSHWFEYEAARAVVLATPLGRLDSPAVAAIQQWVAFGGRAIISAPNAPGWPAALGIRQEPEDGPITDKRFGLGSVSVIHPQTHDKRELAKLLQPVLPPSDIPQVNEVLSVQPKLTLHYVLPSTGLVILAVCAIILILGPLSHLVLAKRKQREAAWVVLPFLSVVLAVVMYAIASSVKGDKSGLETHAVVISFPKTGIALVRTGIRLQSAKQMKFGLRFNGSSIWVGSVWEFYQNQAPAPLLDIHHRHVSLRRLQMQKWSTNDVDFTTVQKALPLTMTAQSNNQVTVTNSSEYVLENAKLQMGGAWYLVAKKIRPGRTAVVSMSASKLSDDDYAYLQFGGDLPRLVAKCDPQEERFSTLEVFPEPINAVAHRTCIWIFGDELKGGAP